MQMIESRFEGKENGVRHNLQSIVWALTALVHVKDTMPVAGIKVAAGPC